MDKLNRLTPVQAAQVLFWVNLLPAAGAATLIVLGFKAGIGFKGFSISLFLLSLLAAEVIYFLQFNFNRYAQSKRLWLYSIIYNGVFALLCLLIAAFTQLWGLIYLIIYPNLFFYISRMIYMKLNTPESI